MERNGQQITPDAGSEPLKGPLQHYEMESLPPDLEREQRERQGSNEQILDQLRTMTQLLENLAPRPTASRVTKPTQRRRTKPGVTPDIWNISAALLAVIAVLYGGTLVFVLGSIGFIAHLILGLFGVAVGVAIVCLLSLPKQVHPTVRWLTTSVAAILLLLAGLHIAEAAYAYYNQRVSAETAATKAAITSVIRKEAKLELLWFKHPISPMPSKISSYLLPPSAGGSRLPQLKAIIATYRSEHHRQAASASGRVEVTSIDVKDNRTSATAHSAEFWYQPIINTRNGHPVTIPVSQLYQSSEQLYFLVKRNHHWMIAGETAPIAPSVKATP